MKAADKVALHGPESTKITTHDLRRTFISHLILGLGLDPVRVARIVGHSNVSVTLNTYAEEFDKRCIEMTSSRGSRRPGSAPSKSLRADIPLT